MFKKASSYMEVYGKTAFSSFDLSKTFPDQFRSVPYIFLWLSVLSLLILKSPRWQQY